MLAMRSTQSEKAITQGRTYTIWFLIFCAHFILAIYFLSDRACGTNASVTGFPLDDTWIHMVYGRSLAEHGLPCYNDGTLEAGFTSPAWLPVLAGAELLAKTGFASLSIIVKLITVVLASIGGIIIYELCLFISGNRTVSLFAALLFTAHPLNAFSQLSGMEVNLTGMLIAAGCLAFVRESYRAIGILCGMAYLSRPESVVIIPVFLVFSLFRETENESCIRLSRPSRLFRIAFPVIISVVLWSTYCFFVTGHPLPNTYYAKFHADINLISVLSVIREILREMTPFKWIGGGIIYLLGVFMICKRWKSLGFLLVIVPWIYAISTGLSRLLPPESGSYFYWWRYWAPIVLLFAIPFSQGFLSLLSGIRDGSELYDNKNHPRLVLLLVAAGITIGPYLSDIPSFSHTFSWNCRNINEVQVALGQWIDENAGQEEAVIVNDAGAIRYFGRRKTIDLLGLNNHKILFSSSRGSSFRMDADKFLDLSRENNAYYLIIFPAWARSLVFNKIFIKEYEPLLFFESENYTIAPGKVQSRMFIFKRKD